MRLAILADIHGNLPALMAVADDLARAAVDQVVVAGDSIHCGPYSAQVVDFLQTAGWAVIRGNHEYYLLDHGTPRAPAIWQDRSRFASLDWLGRQFERRQHQVIGTWADTLSLYLPEMPPLRVLHGKPHTNREGYYATTSEAEIIADLNSIAEAVVITAHTHLPMERRIGRWLLLNPGSVGLPLDGRPEASYLLLDGTPAGWQATFRRVAFDLAAVLAEIDRQDYPRHWGVMGDLIRHEFVTSRPAMVPFLRWHEALHPGQPLTPAMVDEFRQTDLWRYLPPPYRVRP